MRVEKVQNLQKLGRVMTEYFGQKLAMSFLMILATAMAIAEVSASIPAGTSVQVRIIEKLSSETANVGQVFHGTLAAPVVANGRTLFPKGAKVTGEVVNVERSGRLSTPGELHLSLRTIRSGGRTYAVAVPPIVIKGESHTKSNVTKIGGGTAVGALIGAIAGGGKGATIGAGVGAAAGTGAAAATGKKHAQVESEAVLAWEAQSTPTGAAPQRQEQRQSRGDYAEERERMKQHSYNEDEDYDGRGPAGFSTRERQIISDCYVNDRAGLPPDWARVVLSGRIILLDSRQRIVDLFWLQRD